MARQQVHSIAFRALPESALAKKKLLPFPLKYIQKITVAGNEALVQGKLWFVGQGEGGIISSSWVRGSDGKPAAQQLPNLLRSPLILILQPCSATICTVYMQRNWTFSCATGAFMRHPPRACIHAAFANFSIISCSLKNFSIRKFRNGEDVWSYHVLHCLS